MQNLARCDRRGGCVGVSNDFGKPGDEVTGDLDTDLDPITVVDRRERSLNLATQMQRDAIGGLGRVQRPSCRASKWVELCAQRLGNEDLVDPRIHLRHHRTIRRRG